MTAGADGRGARPSQSAKDFAASGLFDGVHIRPKPVKAVGSANLTAEDIAALCQSIAASDATSHVVTQGTDTLEETAFLASLIDIGDLRVVWTGAMRPASDVGADGPRNLVDAVVTATSAASGTYVCMAGQVYDPRYVIKGHRHTVDAFRAHTGALGVVSEGRYVPRSAPKAGKTFAPDAMAGRFPEVGLWTASLGAGAADMTAAAQGKAGLVIASFGGGHLSEAQAEAAKTLASRMPVVLASRIDAGEMLRATYGYAGAEIDLLSGGLIGAGDLSAEKARLALMAAIKAEPENARAVFLTLADGPTMVL